MDDSGSQGFVQVSVPEGYERFMLRQLFEPWAAELLRRADLQPGWPVLDVASGPGPVARLAATAVGPGGRVVASDVSEPMLALAAARPASAGAARIEFLACPASEIDTPDDGFDAVLCQHGLQLPQRRSHELPHMCSGQGASRSTAAGMARGFRDSQGSFEPVDQENALLPAL